MNAYDINGNALAVAYDAEGNALSTAYAADGTAIPFVTFLSTAVLSALTSITESGNKQGACTDGEYIYQFCISPFVGIKYKIADGTYTTVPLGSSVPYDHANDMCYNPNNRHIYVAAMSADGAVMELDTDFNYIATHYLVDTQGSAYAVWGLAFDRKTNHFLSERGNSVIEYDMTFDIVGSFPLPEHPAATGQGCDTDGDFFYRVTYNPNLVDVATMDGVYVTTVSNPMSGEPETLMYDWESGKYYMNKNTSTDVFYEIQLKQ